MKTPESVTDNNDGRKQSKRGMGWCETYLRSLAAGKAQISGPALEHCADYINSADDYIQQLESRLSQAERERDAAVNDLLHHCWNCAYHRDDPIEEIDTGGRTIHRYCDADYCFPDDNSSWQWRGVCPENTKEAAST